MIALLKFHADRAGAVEQHPCDERAGLDRQPIGIARAHLEQPLARSHPAMISRRHRRVARTRFRRLDSPPVVGILDARHARQRRNSRLVQPLANGVEECFADLSVEQRVDRLVLLGVEPAVPAVARWIQPEPAEESPHRPVLAVLHPLEIRAHALGAPRRIAGQIGDRVPVGVVRVDEDHRVVRGAATKRTRTRIQDAVHSLVVVFGYVLVVAPLLRIVFVVANEEVPFDGVVLGRQPVERGNVVVLGIRIRVGLERIAAGDRLRVPPGLQHDDAVAGLGEARGDRSPAGARADDDVVGAEITRWLRVRQRGSL